jgi:ankyrin repeat protein
MNTRQIDEIKKLDLDELTKQVADVNSPLTEGEAKGWTLICVAILQDRLDKVTEFIDAGADCSLAMQGGCEEGRTPIYIAAKYGCLDIVKFLIVEKKVDFKSALQDGDAKGFTPIAAAAANGRENVVRFLVIEMKVDCSSALQDGGAKGWAPIFLAASNGHVDIVRFLIERGVDFKSALQDGNTKGFTLICVAAANGHVNVVRFLIIEMKVDFRSALQDGIEKGFTPVHIAAKHGRENVVRFLVIEMKVDCSSVLQNGSGKGYTLICVAARQGHENVVRFLVIEMKVDCSLALQNGGAKGCTPVYIAAFNGHENVVRFLIERGVDFKSAMQDGIGKGCTPIYAAASKNHILVIRTMLMYWIKSQLRFDRISLKENLNCMLNAQQCFKPYARETGRVNQELEFILSALEASLKEMYSLNYAFSSSVSTPEPWLSDDYLAFITYQNFLQSVNCSYEFFTRVFYAYENFLIINRMNGTTDLRAAMKARIRNNNHNKVVEVEAVTVRENDEAEQAASGTLQAELGFFSSSLTLTKSETDNQNNERKYEGHGL